MRLFILLVCALCVTSAFADSPKKPVVVVKKVSPPTVQPSAPPAQAGFPVAAGQQIERMPDLIGSEDLKDLRILNLDDTIEKLQAQLSEAQGSAGICQALLAKYQQGDRDRAHAKRVDAQQVILNKYKATSNDIICFAPNTFAECKDKPDGFIVHRAPQPKPVPPKTEPKK